MGKILLQILGINLDKTITCLFGMIIETSITLLKNINFPLINKRPQLDESLDKSAITLNSLLYTFLISKK